MAWSIAASAFLAAAGRATPSADEGSTIALTETSVVDLALRRSLSVRLAQLDRTAQRFALKVARYQFVPQVSLTANGQNVDTRDRMTMPVTGNDTATASFNPAISQYLPTGGSVAFGWQNPYTQVTTIPELPGSETRQWAPNWTVSLTQPLLQGGGLTVGMAALTTATTTEKINILAYRGVIIDTVTNALTNFRNYVQAVKQAEIAERAFQRAKDTIEIDKALIDSGRIPKNELVQARADLAIRELAAVTANNARDTARLTLVRLFTLDKATQFTIAQDLVVTEVTPDAAKLTSLAIAQQPSYVQQKLQLSLTELGLAVARNNRLWALNFIATYGGSSADYPYQTALDELYGRKNTAATVGLAVSIPVFGNLVPEQGVVNAKIALRKAQLSLDDLRDALEVQVLENVRDVDVNFRQVQLARTARQLTEEKLLFERDKLKSGLSSTFEVVQFEDDLINAQNSELSAIISYQNALTVLDQTVGSTLDTWKIQFNPNPETPR